MATQPLYQYPSGPIKPTLLQQFMTQAGTLSGLASLMVQTLGKWAAGAAAATAQATSLGITSAAAKGAAQAAKNLTAITGDAAVGAAGPSSGFMTWADKILNNPYFSKVLGVATVFLSAYSLYNSLPQFFKKTDFTNSIAVGGAVVGLAMGINAILHAGALGPPGWFMASAVVLGMSVYSVVTDGPTATGVATVAVATVATAVLFNFLAGAALLAGPVGWIVAGIVIAVAAIIGLVADLLTQKSDEHVAALNTVKALTPIIYTLGPLAFVTMGTTALLFGWSRDQIRPISSPATLSHYSLNRLLTAQKNPFVLPEWKGQDAPAVLIEKGIPPGIPGKNPTPTYVTIVSPPSDGYTVDSLQTFALDPLMRFTSCSENPNGFIPFFTYHNGHIDQDPNPDLLTAMKNQEYMLRTILSGALSTKEMLSAVQLASAANKICTAPISVN